MTNKRGPIILNDQGEVVTTPIQAEHSASSQPEKNSPTEESARAKPLLIETENTSTSAIDVGWNPAIATPSRHMNRFSSGKALTAGLLILMTGFVVTETINYVERSFSQHGRLGWIALAVCIIGFGLVGYAIWREVVGYLSLDKWDDKRRVFAEATAVEQVRQITDTWLGNLAFEGIDRADVMTQIIAAKQVQEINEIIERKVLVRLDQWADEAVSKAMIQVGLTTALTPSEKFEVFIFIFQGLRLVRNVASIYGLRPGNLGTLALLRRLLFGATTVVGANTVAAYVMQSIVTSPIISKFAGEIAGAGAATQRMNRLGRAAIAACRLLPSKASP